MSDYTLNADGTFHYNGQSFAFDFSFPVVTKDGGLITKTMTFCNFRRYGFSVQDGPADIQMEQGTAQVAFGGYGRHLMHDSFYAAFYGCLMNFIARYPHAAPVIFGQEFQRKAALVLTGCFYHHEKHTNRVNNEPIDSAEWLPLLRQEFRCAGDYQPQK